MVLCLSDSLPKARHTPAGSGSGIPAVSEKELRRFIREGRPKLLKALPAATGKSIRRCRIEVDALTKALNRAAFAHANVQRPASR